MNPYMSPKEKAVYLVTQSVANDGKVFSSPFDPDVAAALSDLAFDTESSVTTEYFCGTEPDWEVWLDKEEPVGIQGGELLLMGALTTKKLAQAPEKCSRTDKIEGFMTKQNWLEDELEASTKLSERRPEWLNDVRRAQSATPTTPKESEVTRIETATLWMVCSYKEGRAPQVRYNAVQDPSRREGEVWAKVVEASGTSREEALRNLRNTPEYKSCKKTVSNMFV